MQYLSPYKRYVVGALGFNLLSAILNVFSFLSIMPMLNILFKIDTTEYVYIAWGSEGYGFKDVLVNNMYYYTQQLINVYGPSQTLLMLGGFLIIATLLKCSSYFAGVGIMVPMRTGIVRDIRRDIYHKVVSLPLSFFSSERRATSLPA